MFPSFAKFVVEELTAGQKKVVDVWANQSKAESISKHVIPSGQHRMVLSLDDPHDGAEQHVEAPSHIKQHLENAGYKIKNYKTGVVEDKHGRETKIGKALVASKAPKEYVDHVNGDPSRTASKKVHNNLEVVVSRHPYDVAGMSTDRGWTSCMRMGTPTGNPHEDRDPANHYGGGINKEYLPHEIKHGTHVAYLVNKGDHEVKNPIARIALKPYHSPKYEHTILRPEGTTYGSPASSFEHTVNQWVNHHFPMKDEHETYHKNDDVYDDSSPRTISNYNNIIKDPHKLMNVSAFHISDTVRELKNSHQLAPAHFDALFKHPHGVDSIIRYGGDAEHKKLLSHKYFGLTDHHSLGRHTGSPEVAEHLANHSNDAFALQSMLLNNEKLSKGVLDKSAQIVANRLKTGNHSFPEHEKANLLSALASNHEHTHKTLLGTNHFVDREIATTTTDHNVLQHLAKHEDHVIRAAAFRNYKMPLETSLAALKNDKEHYTVHEAVAQNLQSHDLRPHLKDLSNDAKSWIAGNSIHRSTLEALSYDSHPSIVASTVMRGIHLDRLSHHEDPVIRELARAKLRGRLGSSGTALSHWTENGNLADHSNVGKTYDQLINKST